MGNKNNGNNTGFVQVGYPHNSCNNSCDNNCEVTPATPYNTGCQCDDDHTAAYNGNGCGCDHGAAYPVDTCGQKGRWGKKHGGDQCCNCDCDSGNADETHIFFESCDGAKEVCVTGRCQEDEAPGRTLDVNCTLLNVCPGRRSALGITLTEMDENGAEYARGFRAITVPAHNARCNQDIEVDTVRFILPEDLSLQDRRHFVVRTQHHYLDASSIWNNSWGR